MIDLFASPQNHKLPLWFGRLHSQEAAASNAFSQSWRGWSVYAFPPFNLIFSTLLKIRHDQVEEAIVVLPFWPRRPWFPLLLEMACENPVRFRPKLDLLSQKLAGRGTLFHPDIRNLQLTAWKLNANPGKQQAFQKTLSQRRLLPNVPLPERYTTNGGAPTASGAPNDTLIPFQLL
jgi:hypothetical protein